MKSTNDLIREHAFLAGIKDTYIKLMAGCATNITFKKEQYLIHEGEPADQFYLIRDGAVALESHAPGHGPVIFCTLKECDFLGVSWLTPPYRWQFDARAVEPVRAVAFDAECLRGKCDADPTMGYALMKRFVPALMQRLKAARIQMMDVYGGPSNGKKQRSGPDDS